MFKLRGFLMIVLALGLILSGCGAPAASETIKIAVASPITGDDAVWGMQAVRGAEMAIEDINAAGGILGKQIELIKFDDKGDSKEAASVAQRILSDPSIVAVIGHFYSSCSLAAGPIYSKGKIPMMAVASTNPKVVNSGDFVFRINPNDASAGAEMAVYTVEKMGKKRIGVLVDQMDYAQGVFEAFSAKAQELGAEIVSVQKYVGKQDKDFSVMLTSIKETDPDVILISGLHVEAAQITQQARGLGIETTIIIPDGATNPDYITLAGTSAEGVIAFSYFDPGIQDAKIQELAARYKEKYGEEILTYVPYAYDAMLAVAEAIKKAGSTDGTAIRTALEELKDVPGVTGPISFTNRDRAIGWNVVLVVENGSYKLIGRTTD